MQDFRNLVVWEKAHQLTLDVYQATSSFPRAEQFGLTSQMRRAASSVPSNIAEGCARGSDPEFARFLNIARGSASELDYQLLLSRDLGYLDPQRAESLAADTAIVKRMLSAFISKLTANS